MTQYWIIIEGEPHGPLTAGELEAMNLPDSTPVWCEGLTDWTTLERLREREGQGVVPPPIPEPRISYAAPMSQPQAKQVEAAPTLLGWSVAATLLCCTILGIGAIVYSIKVRNANERGDYAAGWRAYRTLELWLISTVVLGIVCAPFTMIINMLSSI